MAKYYIMMINMWKMLCRVAMVLVAGFLSVRPVTLVSAKLPENEMYYYSESKIYFYNPREGNRCVESGASGTVEIDPSGIFVAGDDNASGIIGTLVSNGYSQEAAAAIVGNLYAESRLNPRVLQGGVIVSDGFRAWDGGKTYDGGFGLVQWDYPSRVENLQNYADGRGLPVASLQAQVGFMIQELTDYGYPPSVLNNMSLEDAVHEIWRNYENPATSDYDTRLEYARQFLGVEPGSLPEVVSSGGNGGGTVICVPEGYGGAGTPVSMDGVVSFLQCDPAWGELSYGDKTICMVGCGPTSFASIAATLGVSITPAEAAQVANSAGMYVSGQGSSWAITKTLASHFGLKYEPLGEVSVEHINELLREGKMIHVAGEGAMPYTEGGHYIGIVGITDTGEWIVTDSGHDEASAVMAYDPQQILAGMHAGSAGVVWR